MKNYVSLLLLSLLMAMGCNTVAPKAPKIIIIQPLGAFPKSLSRTVWNQIKIVNPNTLLQENIPLPEQAYYPVRNRYRADSIISIFHRKAGKDTVWITLTEKDISTTKDGIADWGIMGLAYRPGRACVVSTFRLDKQKIPEQFYKVAIHELGHSQGLDHCPQQTCYMRDAEGGNPTDEETGFCPSCKTILKKKGWRLL
ncbi:Zn-dependent protease [Taibaiella sp. KBW10]|uniref:Zn-dependent protease n=1 Tax=Taibaiella sp. KBW10 TaxID=2153357 RepID=UPI000F59B5A4|nr:Zn-dependent protease [Taibaiella sp. KBW10]RQO29968.1 Zn-dependent protease [Taibaiella sp. KBW10]